MHELIKILLLDRIHDDSVTAYLREKTVFDNNYYIHFDEDLDSSLIKFREDEFDVVIIRFDRLEVKDFIDEAKKIDPDCCIIVFFENESSEFIAEASKLGVYESITLPVSAEKFLFLVKKGAQLHMIMSAHRRFSQSLNERNSSLQKQNMLLARRIEESTKNLTKLYEDLRSTYLRTIKALAQVIDARDHYTHSHSQSVAKYAVAIAEELKLSTKEIELIREACELHDLGKIGIHDDILTKPSALDASEWKLMKQHPDTGAQILQPLTFLNGVIDLIRQHHEHFDGTGYPQGLRGEDILLGARIIHLADAYEAMISARSYRKIPFSREEAILEIKNNTGTQFDPRIVKTFLKIVNSTDFQKPKERID